MYTANQFKFPYDGTDTANNHYIPDVCSAPFVEMYLEGVYDFEPTGQNGGNNQTDSSIICKIQREMVVCHFQNLFQEIISVLVLI